MTKEALIEEIKKLSPEDRWEIIEAANELAEEDYDLTDDEMKTLDERWEKMHEQPGTTVTYDEFKNRLDTLTKK